MLAILLNNDEPNNDPDKAGYEKLIKYIERLVLRKSGSPDPDLIFWEIAEYVHNHGLACFRGYPVIDIPHNPSQCCKKCGSLQHNTWSCSYKPIETEYPENCGLEL